MSQNIRINEIPRAQQQRQRLSPALRIVFATAFVLLAVIAGVFAFA